MIFLFTVTAPGPATTGWYARWLTSDISYCHHELTTMLQPFPSNITLDEWLELQLHDHDFELAQRRRVLQGYPEYFRRHWERLHWDQHVVGNSDDFAGPMLPGLWLLWPDMRFLISYADGISEVDGLWRGDPDRLIRAPASDPFERACRHWASRVDVLERTRMWLTDRGVRCLTPRVEDLATNESALETIWNSLVGDWPTYVEHSSRAWNELSIVPVEETWETWDDAQRAVFVRICGDSQARLGYAIPGDDAVRQVLPQPAHVAEAGNATTLGGEAA